LSYNKKRKNEKRTNHNRAKQSFEPGKHRNNYFNVRFFYLVFIPHYSNNHFKLLTKNAMKTVFRSTNEVCHVFASQTQSEGRANSVFFSRDTIYSYGYHFPMAKILNRNTVLITDRSYSVTTAKHLSELRSAVSHYENRIYCNNPKETIFENIKHIGFDLRQCFLTLNNPRKKAVTKETAKLEIQRIIENTNKLLQAFNTDINKLQKEFKKQFRTIDFKEDSKILEFFDLWEVAQNLDLDKLAKLNAKRTKKLAAIEKRKQKQLEKENAEKIANWLNGENAYIRNVSKVYLRVNGEEIETSQGAFVPLHEGKFLFQMIQAGKDIKGHTIGNYTVLGINGVLTIGCHKIERSEIERFAQLMKWI
jgi:hypothetical protein